MPKAPAVNDTPSKKSKASASRAAARNTDSGPANPPVVDDADPAVQKAAQTGDMAAAMAFNANKAGEHGFANGLRPQPGETVEAPSRLPGSSTLTEENSSERVGSVAPEGGRRPQHIPPS